MTAARWYLNRLRAMSTNEIRMRAGNTLTKRRWRSMMTSPPIPTGVPTSPLQQPTLEVSPSAAEAVADASARLLDGEWMVFNRPHPSIGSDPDWFVDARTGRIAPRDVYAFDLDHRDEAVVGNIKYVWEPSRHQHLSLLAANYALHRDEASARRIERHLRSWWAENPFLHGVHWTSAIEVSIRLISWVWIRRLLSDWAGVRDLFDDNSIFRQQLYNHQRYVDAFASHGSSANNHLIAELSGQLTASLAFPWFDESTNWSNDAVKGLSAELRRQTFPSGINRELATGYHGFVLELALVGLAEASAHGIEIEPSAWSVARSMMDAIAALCDVREAMPRLGDDDNGVGLLLDGPTSQRWSSLLCTGAALFGALEWWPEGGPTDVRTACLASIAVVPPLPDDRPTTRPNHFKDAGLALLRATLDGAEVWASFDHGPHGYLSIAAHAHADALSLEVRHDGVEVLSDPGTYCYHGEREWRDALRSTIAHNTVEIGGRNQSQIGGPFLWTKAANTRLIDVEQTSDGAIATITAEHDGYAPMAHRRTVALVPGTAELRIRDVISMPGGATTGVPIRVAFHFGPEINASLDDSTVVLRWVHDQFGQRDALLTLSGGLVWSMYHGDAVERLGWYSESFDSLVPTSCVVGTAEVGPSDSSYNSALTFQPGGSK